MLRTCLEGGSADDACRICCDSGQLESQDGWAETGVVPRASACRTPWGGLEEGGALVTRPDLSRSNL